MPGFTPNCSTESTVNVKKNGENYVMFWCLVAFIKEGRGDQPDLRDF